MNKIRMMIVDDFEDIRNYFTMVLSKESDMEVVGTAASGEEAVRIALIIQPDILLMDIQMETELAGIDAIRMIKEQLPMIKVIVLTIHEEDDILFKAYGAGAIDYIVKTSSIVEILTSVRDVFSNELSLRPKIAEKILGEFSRLQNEQMSLMHTLNIMTKLTNAEYEVLRAIHEGLTYKQIAEDRFVEEVTIRTQVTKILKKFEKNNLKEVVRQLERLKIFDVYKSQ